MQNFSNPEQLMVLLHEKPILQSALNNVKKYTIDANSTIQIHDYNFGFKWNNQFLEIKAYFEVINKFYLPNNIFSLDFTLLNTENKNIPLLQQNQSCIKNFNPQFECKVYGGEFKIDALKNNLLKNEYNNEKVKFNWIINYNNKAFEGTTKDEVNIPNDILDKFTSKLNLIKDENFFFYNNNFKIVAEKNKNIFHHKINNEWVVSKDAEAIYKSIPLSIKTYDWSSNKNKAIKNILKFSTQNQYNFRIEEIRSKLRYHIKNNGNYEKLDLDKSHFDLQEDANREMAINFKPSFFNNSNKLSFGLGRENINGLFIPKISNGNLDFKSTIFYHNVPFLVSYANTFEFKKEFLLNKDAQIRHLISRFKIKSLNALTEYEELLF